MFVKRLCLLVIIFSVFLFAHTSQAQTWTQLSPTGGVPTTRYEHTAVYDSANNRMIVFGGNEADSLLNDVWVLSTANGIGGMSAWTQLLPTGSIPTSRSAHTAIYDATNNRMTIFGGSSANTSLNDVWVLSNANGLDSTTSAWTQLSPTGSAPTTRQNHTAVYDNTNNRMIIFGGYINNFLTDDLNDVWVLSNANGLGGIPVWTQLISDGNNPSAPTTRWGHSAVYDASNNRMTIFGGQGGGYLWNDVWVLSNANGLDSTTSSWKQLFPTGSAPTTRKYHTAIYDATNNRMTVFGGRNDEFLLNDVWVLDNADVVPVEDWMLYATESKPF